MKKIALLLLSIITLTSCSIEDDGPNIVSALAEVTDHNLPEYFEEGKVHTFEVSYKLPDLCHQPLGLQLNRGSNYGDERRDIYVVGVVSYNLDQGECTTEPGDPSDLIETTELVIKIDETEPYTFYFWTGKDSTGENIFEVVEVPVGAPTPEVTE